MKFNDIIWNQKNYQQFLNYLDSLIEEPYRKFQQGLILDGKPLRGIRTPVLQTIAKNIVTGDYKAFLAINKMDSYEEILLYGLVIAKANMTFSEQLNYLESFIFYIDNWAVNDIVCSSLKSFQKHQEDGLRRIDSYLHSNNPWSIRFGLVLLLSHYINDTYIDTVLKLSNTIQSDEYYVKMANAWLISICYIKYKEKTNVFLKETTIDNWTFHKAISKIRDSKRVSNEEKEQLIKLKRDYIR